MNKITTKVVQNASVETVTVVGIDLAKNMFAIHGINTAAICEAVTRPTMRFVPIKSEDAQATLTMHRVRQGFVEERAATINRIRGLMSEFDIVLPQKADTVRRSAYPAWEHLPGWASRPAADLLAHVTLLDVRVTEYDTHLNQVAKEDDRCRRLMQMPRLAPSTPS